jgi:surface antigen
MKLWATLIAALLVLSGCNSTGLGGGRLAGDGMARGDSNRTATDRAAAMGGGLIGGAVGKDLSDGERRRALAAEYRALEYGQSGQATDWKGSGDARTGSVVPAQPYRVGSQDCRQYTHTVTIDGASQTARGTACRNADGSWTTLT